MYRAVTAGNRGQAPPHFMVPDTALGCVCLGCMTGSGICEEWAALFALYMREFIPALYYYTPNDAEFFGLPNDVSEKTTT